MNDSVLSEWGVYVTEPDAEGARTWRVKARIISPFCGTVEFSVVDLEPDSAALPTGTDDVLRQTGEFLWRLLSGIKMYTCPTLRGK